MSKNNRRKLGIFILIFALVWGTMEPAARLGAETGETQGEENNTTNQEEAGSEVTDPDDTNSGETDPDGDESDKGQEGDSAGENDGTGDNAGSNTGDNTDGGTGDGTGDDAGGNTGDNTGGDQTEVTPAPTPEVVEITAYSGYSKYFGQENQFYKGLQYSLPESEEKLDDNVTLTLESEEVGMQKFKVEDGREPEEKAKKEYKIKNEATALYEIKPYYVPADIKLEDMKLNCKDQEDLDKDKDNKITLQAPTGYKICSGPGEDNTLRNADWQTTLEVTLTEGKNIISYYLSSAQEDITRGAIDQTEKQVKIDVDWIAPQITAIDANQDTDVSGTGNITGTEDGKYYYIVLPEQVANEEADKKDEDGNPIGITADYIRSRVASHYGIVGYGRVDANKPADIAFNGLLAETSYLVYAFMEDNAGNESPVMSSLPFTTEKIALAGTVEITGTMALDETVQANEKIESASPGDLSYQWYRVKNSDDAASLDEAWDETGGADADDLEAEIDEEDEEDEDDDDGDDTYELDRFRKLAEKETDDVTVIGVDAIKIEGATSKTYKITKDDIGYRLICEVRATNCSGYIAGESTTFVPKLIPEVTRPAIASAMYSNTRTLASIKLPERWSWVDNTIVPVYGNSGYRARFIPENTTMYRTVVVRINVPVTKKPLAKKMLTLKKTHSYTGKAIKNNFYLGDGEDELVLGKDYRVTYRNNKKIGKAYITIKGIGNYKGSIKGNYKIVTCSVKSLKYKFSKKKVYTGKARTAGVVIKNGTVKLKKNKDYTIKYKSNKMIGRATITIRGKGNYKGKKVLHFEIVPSKPKIVKVTKKKTSFRLKFSKSKQVSGYRVYVSTSSSFSKKKTQQYVTTGNGFGMYGLTAGTYYTRIKSYGSKKGKTYESSYSSSRKIKIKK